MIVVVIEQVQHLLHEGYRLDLRKQSIEDRFVPRDDNWFYGPVAMVKSVRAVRRSVVVRRHDAGIFVAFPALADHTLIETQLQIPAVCRSLALTSPLNPDGLWRYNQLL